MISRIFKSRKYIFLFSMIFTLIELLIITATNYYIPFEYTTLPALSIFFGPYAVLGFTLIETGYLIVNFHTTDISIILINALITFIFGIIPWKIWYSFMNKHGLEIPNINRAYNFIKVVIIMMIIYTYAFGVLYNEWSINENIAIVYYTTVITFIIIIFTMQLLYTTKIPSYTPKIQIKGLIPDKLYLICLLISISIPAYFYIFNVPNESSLIIISLFFMCIFLIKPYGGDIYKISDKLKPNTFYKICVSILVILLILSAIITISLNHILYIESKLEMDFIISFLYDFTNILFPFMIPMIIYILFLEKKVMEPITKLSQFLSKDMEYEEDIDELKENLNTITVNNEIKSLSNSMLNMEKDLVDYSENLIEVTNEKEKYETELKLAREIQYSMVPTDFEKFYENEDFRIWGIMKAAREVGGDFYDYFKIDDENIGFVIGDVSGKGITAALIMVKAMTLIQDYVKHYDDLSKAVWEVNNQLCEGNAENLFVTSWIGKLNTKTGKLLFVNAGHNPPLIKQGNNDFEYLKTKPELFLACMEDMPYKTETLQMNSGDKLFLYTDGVTEANDNYNGFYGNERLQKILNEHKNDKLKDIVKSVEKDIDDFCDHQDPFDDTTILILRKK